MAKGKNRGRKMRKGAKAKMSRALSLPVNARIHRFKKTLIGSYVNVYSNTDTTAGYLFRLNTLQDWPDIVNMYDQYCIYKVIVRLEPLNNQALVNAAPGGGGVTPATLGHIYSVIDYNDVSNITLNNLVQYSTFKYTRSDRVHKRVIYPKTFDLVFSSSTSVTNAGSPKTQYIDTAHPETDHYGLKVYFEAGGGNTENICYIVRPVITYYFRCKKTR